MFVRGVHLYILLFLAIRAVHTRANCSCDLPDPSFANGVNFIYYDCSKNATVNFPIDTPQGLLDKLAPDKRTIFYIFGYLQTPQDRNVQIMMNALCYNNTDNVVLLDWSKYNQNLVYPSVFKDAEKVGRLFAKSIRLLRDQGFDVSGLYIIGFSLGSHMAGFAGKCNDFVIPRITGLEPANPLFQPVEYILQCYLAKTDAKWVDIIHTDVGFYGTALDSGIAEYYANKGTRVQPGCPEIFVVLGSYEDVCSHERSVEIYAASKRHPDKFIATQCDSYPSYTLGICNNNLHTGVGYAASPDVEGSFYFTTGIVSV